MLPEPHVATVVLNYRGIDDTVACVRALMGSTVLDQRIIVVDNEAPGPEHDALRAAVPERVEVVATGGNLGYAAGNNVGIRMAMQRRPEYVWLVNPDLRVEPETLEGLLATAHAIKDAGVIGPRIVHGGTTPSKIWFDGGIFDRAKDGATSHLHDGRLEADVPVTGPRDVGYVTGACMLVRADVVRTVGTIPEDYFLYFEETDYCQRVKAAGWRLLADPRARAVHHKRSSGDLPTVAYVYYMRRNKELFARAMGLDTARVVAQFEKVWVDPWRANITRRAPGWVETFDALIAQAAADAAAGRGGRRDDLDRFASAEAFRLTTAEA
ncbi:MAG: glycosyltransferase family 2 protein [Kineosporiaceae bacterium]